MKWKPLTPSRVFSPTAFSHEDITDIGGMELEVGEQLTLLSSDIPINDITKRSWGYQLTRSSNLRILEVGWRVGIMRNRTGRTYVILVDQKRMQSFEEYITLTKHDVVLWVDELGEVQP